MLNRLKSFAGWAFGELKSIAAKEIFKYLVLTVGALLSASIIGFLSSFFGGEAPLTVEQFKEHPYEWTIGLLRAEPVHSFSVLFVIALVIAFLFLLRRASWRFEEQSKLLDGLHPVSLTPA